MSEQWTEDSMVHDEVSELGGHLNHLELFDSIQQLHEQHDEKASPAYDSNSSSYDNQNIQYNEELDLEEALSIEWQLCGQMDAIICGSCVSEEKQKIQAESNDEIKRQNNWILEQQDLLREQSKLLDQENSARKDAESEVRRLSTQVSELLEAQIFLKNQVEKSKVSAYEEITQTSARMQKKKVRWADKEEQLRQQIVEQLHALEILKQEKDARDQQITVFKTKIAENEFLVVTENKQENENVKKETQDVSYVQEQTRLLQDEVSELTAQLMTKEQEVKSQNDHINELYDAIAKESATVAELNATNQDLEESLYNATKISKDTKDVAGFQAEISRLKFAHKTKIQSLKYKIKTTEKLYENSKLNENKAQEDLLSSQEQIQKLSEDLAQQSQLTVNRHSSETQLSQHREEIKRLRGDLVQASIENDSLVQSKALAVKQLEQDYQKQLQELQTTNETLVQQLKISSESKKIQNSNDGNKNSTSPDLVQELDEKEDQILLLQQEKQDLLHVRDSSRGKLTETKENLKLASSQLRNSESKVKLQAAELSQLRDKVEKFEQLNSSQQMTEIQQNSDPKAGLHKRAFSQKLIKKDQIQHDSEEIEQLNEEVQNLRAEVIRLNSATSQNPIESSPSKKRIQSLESDLSFQRNEIIQKNIEQATKDSQHSSSVSKFKNEIAKLKDKVSVLSNENIGLRIQASRPQSFELSPSLYQSPKTTLNSTYSAQDLTLSIRGSPAILCLNWSRICAKGRELCDTCACSSCKVRQVISGESYCIQCVKYHESPSREARKESPIRSPVKQLEKPICRICAKFPSYKDGRCVSCYIDRERMPTHRNMQPEVEQEDETLYQHVTQSERKSRSPKRAKKRRESPNLKKHTKNSKSITRIKIAQCPKCHTKFAGNRKDNKCSLCHHFFYKWKVCSRSFIHRSVATICPNCRKH